MLLDLTRYRQPSARFARTFQPSEMATDGDAFQVVEPAELSFEIAKDKDVFRLTGVVGTVLELSCSRCADPFRQRVDASFDLRYQPLPGAAHEAERELADEDLETSYYTDDQIDLNELMREQFYLALPMKPLCTEQCHGLCAHCGANLNSGGCSCHPAWDDQRLAALKALQARLDS